jgi:hypothetical protein
VSKHSLELVASNGVVSTKGGELQRIPNTEVGSKWAIVSGSKRSAQNQKAKSDRVASHSPCGPNRTHVPVGNGADVQGSRRSRVAAEGQNRTGRLAASEGECQPGYPAFRCPPSDRRSGFQDGVRADSPGIPTAFEALAGVGEIGRHFRQCEQLTFNLNSTSAPK